MRATVTLTLFAALLVLPSCSGYIHAGAFKPTWDDATSRLEAYLEADEELAEIEKRAVLRELDIGTAILEEALAP